MPAVLVHGVADTPHVWDAVRARLGRPDVVALTLPGFNSPVPEGFDATKEAYLDWLVAEIEKLDEPVDLVGHDWGCILTARLASVRPDLVRTWAGSSGPVDAEYDWHDFAKIWQTPGEGERWMRELDLDAFAEQLAGFAMPTDDARLAVGFIDDVMKDCILKLYRSAVHVGREWDPALPESSRPASCFGGSTILSFHMRSRIGSVKHQGPTPSSSCDAVIGPRWNSQTP